MYYQVQVVAAKKCLDMIQRLQALVRGPSHHDPHLSLILVLNRLEITLMSLSL
jgi:hypothetical protein